MTSINPTKSYIAAANAYYASPAAVLPARPTFCPECSTDVPADNDVEADHTYADNGVLLVGCEGYHVQDPSLFGVQDANWQRPTAAPTTSADDETGTWLVWRSGDEDKDPTPEAIGLTAEQAMALVDQMRVNGYPGAYAGDEHPSTLDDNADDTYPTGAISWTVSVSDGDGPGTILLRQDVTRETAANLVDELHAAGTTGATAYNTMTDEVYAGWTLYGYDVHPEPDVITENLTRDAAIARADELTADGHTVFARREVFGDLYEGVELVNMTTPDKAANVVVRAFGDTFVVVWDGVTAPTWTEHYDDVAVAMTRVAAIMRAAATNQFFKHSNFDDTEAPGEFVTNAITFLDQQLQS